VGERPVSLVGVQEPEQHQAFDLSDGVAEREVGVRQEGRRHHLLDCSQDDFRHEARVNAAEDAGADPLVDELAEHRDAGLLVLLQHAPRRSQARNVGREEAARASQFAHPGLETRNQAGA
jgi:citrate lyase beta subunit